MLEIIVDRTTKQQKEAINSLLKCKKKRYHGQGSTAKVWLFPQSSGMSNDWVLRKQWWHDDYYIGRFDDYTRFCAKSKSKHTPKILFHAVVRGSYGIKETITVMERLTPIHYHEDLQDGGIWNPDWAEYGIEDATQGFWNSRYMKTPIKTKSISRKSFMTFVNKAKDGGVVFNDCHPGNIMIRPSDKKVVIIDPSV